MKIQRVQNNYVNYGKSTNYNKRQNIFYNSSISFQSRKPQLITISPDSFKSENAKKIYSKILKYYQLIGKEGSIKDVKLLHEKINDFSSKPPFIYYVDADVCLSINKNDRNSNIKLYHKYQNTKKQDALILNAILDKNGQMFRGEFFPENLVFERDGKNVRRMYSNFSGDNYLPVGNNDREWSCLGKPKPSAEELIEDSEKGAFEIFIELARLKTSIMK